MPAGLSPVHLIIILIIALIVIGPGKLPEVGAALGKSIKEFRKAASDVTESTAVAAAPVAAAPVAAAPVVAPPVAAAPIAPMPIVAPAAIDPSQMVEPTSTEPPSAGSAS